jgi:hypothetical protein
MYISAHFLELLGIGVTFVGICVSTVRPKMKKKLIYVVCNLCNSKFRGTKPHPFNILKNFHHENLNELVIFLHFVDIQHVIIYTSQHARAVRTCVEDIVLIFYFLA